MKFTKQAEYAVILASELACDKCRSLREIAGRCQISYAFLRKVAFKMAGYGLIKGEEGKNGGYHLVKSAQEISLKDILDSIGEPLITCSCCEGGKECSTSAVCPRNSILASLQKGIGEIFGSLTLDALIKGNKSCMKIWKS